MAEFKQLPNNSNYRQGRYQLINESKYVGDPQSVIYRSGYELRFMKYVDMNENVLRWGSEVNEIIYRDPAGKPRRYYPDFYVVVKDENSETGERIYIIEVKPLAECQTPKKPKRITPKSLKSYEYRVQMFKKNICKWKAAKDWCDKNGVEFLIATEDFLFKNNR